MIVVYEEFNKLQFSNTAQLTKYLSFKEKVKIWDDFCDIVKKDLGYTLEIVSDGFNYYNVIPSATETDMFTIKLLFDYSDHIRMEMADDFLKSILLDALDEKKRNRRLLRQRNKNRTKAE